MFSFVRAAIDAGAGITLSARLCDASGAPFDAELRARIVLSRPIGDAHQLGCTFLDVRPAVMRQLVEFCYIVCPYERLHGSRPTNQAKRQSRTSSVPGPDTEPRVAKVSRSG